MSSQEPSEEAMHIADGWTKCALEIDALRERDRAEDKKRIEELERSRSLWEEDAKRYAQNAEHWNGECDRLKAENEKMRAAIIEWGNAPEIGPHSSKEDLKLSFASNLRMFQVYEEIERQEALANQPADRGQESHHKRPMTLQEIADDEYCEDRGNDER